MSCDNKDTPSEGARGRLPPNIDQGNSGPPGNFDPSKFGPPGNFDPSKFGPPGNFDPSKFGPPGSFDPSKFGPPGIFDPSKMKLDLSKWAGVPNPYHWPLMLRNTNIKYNDVTVMFSPIRQDPLTRVKKIRALPVRDDDIFLLAFPKSGTHWLSEILHMLLRGSTTYNKTGKENTMIDMLDDLDSLEKEASPRVLNSHYYLAHLPEGILEKKIKIIHVTRNPKDTAVSWFHHLKQLPITPPEFDFENFLMGYLEEGYSIFGHQFDYLRQVSEFEKNHPDHPIINVYYEDLKQDPIPIVQKLAKFLGVEASESLCDEIIEACGFNKLKTADNKRNEENGTHPPLNVFRKGVVGDWKNKFTVAQNEKFDEFIHQHKEKGFGDFKFKGI